MPTDPSHIAFSICIPVYNGRKFLSETLESVRRQTHPHWELIIIEDASPDPSRDIVEDFAAKVPQKVTYHVNAQNLKTAHTRDEAFKLAACDYIALLDYDDLWKPNHLAEMARVFSRQNADVVLSGFSNFRGDIQTIEGHYTPEAFTQNELRLARRLDQFPTTQSAMAFRRSVLDVTGPWATNIAARRRELSGFPETCEGSNFFFNLLKSGFDLHWTGTLTTYYRQNEKSQRSHGLKHVHLQQAWLNNHYGVIPGLPAWPQRKYIAQICANAGRALRKDSEHARLGALFLFRAWRWYPFRLDRLALSLRALVHC